MFECGARKYGRGGDGEDCAEKGEEEEGGDEAVALRCVQGAQRWHCR
jgi:hypothetical protein